MPRLCTRGTCYYHYSTSRCPKKRRTGLAFCNLHRYAVPNEEQAKTVAELKEKAAGKKIPTREIPEDYTEEQKLSADKLGNVLFQTTIDEKYLPRETTFANLQYKR